MGLHICISNPDAFSISSREGVYGNVGSADDNDQVFWGKLRDLYALIPGDLVLFYVKEDQVLKGIYEVTSNPYLCSDNLFGNNEKYPFRFNFEIHEYYPNGIPSFELYKLIDQGVINSISSLERDVMASYRGIRQLSMQDLDELKILFRKYNPKTDPSEFDRLNPNVNATQIEAFDFDPSSLDDIHEPVEILFNRIPVQNNYARFETVIHVYIAYNLLHDSNDLRSIFDLDEFSEVILEAPVFKSMQRRSDILVLFGDKSQNYFHSFIELKRNSNIRISDLSQLIGYLKSFAEARNLSLNSYEGIFVSTRFRDDVLNYLRNRTEVEGENIVRLISYEVDDLGKVSFNNLI